MRIFYVSFILTLLFLYSTAQAGEFRDVTPEYIVKIPEDFYFKKNFRIQWWYFTGHLFDDTGREFGYEITFFIAGVQKRTYKSQFGINNIYISHFAISDIETGTFIYKDRADSGSYNFAGAKEHELRVWVGKNMLEGTVKKMNIKASDETNSIDLILTPVKSVVLNGMNGYSRKSETSPLNASIYFSFSCLQTEGNIQIGKKTFQVKGKSWFDREIFTRGLEHNQKGWDWFSIQLDDDREVMLYIIRNTDGTLDRFSSGTFVYADGTYRNLSIDDFKVTVLSHYTSKKTGAKYPSQWKIDIPSENIILRITPLIEGQEFSAFNSTGNYYWEGTCKVEGTVNGRAYLEMTGY